MAIRVTAKTLVPHLLVAMESASGKTTNLIKVDDAFIEKVCELANIDPECLGRDPKGNRLVNRQVLYAERVLRDRGIAQKCRRGYYQLSDSHCGATETETVTPTPTPVVTPTPTPTVSKVEESWEDLVEVEVEKPTNPLLYTAPVEGFPSVGIYKDAHLRGIAVSQTKCFGHWSGSARSVCSACPLAKFCFEKQNLDLEAFAVSLLEKKSAPKSDTPQSDDAPKKAKATKAKAKKGAKMQVDMSKCRQIKAALAGSCVHCKKPHEVGEDVIWVPGEGTFHVDCVEAI